MKNLNSIILFVYVIFGLYFINLSFNFINLPGFFLNFNKWINLVAGILIIFGGFNFFKNKRLTS